MFLSICEQIVEEIQEQSEKIRIKRDVKESEHSKCKC